MHRPAKIDVSSLNEHLVCGLCFGYLVDATTIVECLHSFCRSCIVLYVSEKNGQRNCPLCCQLIHETRPLLNIRPDKTLQNLVYKLVPNMFRDEMRRRRNFYAEHPNAVPDANIPNASEERGDAEDESCFSSQETDEEQISVCLRHSNLLPGNSLTLPEVNDERYLLCPAYVTVAVLKKFIRCKFGLPNHIQIELFYWDEFLDNSYTLQDIAHLYAWRRLSSLRLFYVIIDPSPLVIQALQQSLVNSTCSSSSVLANIRTKNETEGKFDVSEEQLKHDIHREFHFKTKQKDNKTEISPCDSSLTDKEAPTILPFLNTFGTCKRCDRSRCRCLSTASGAFPKDGIASEQSSSSGNKASNTESSSCSNQPGVLLEQTTSNFRCLSPLRLRRLSPCSASKPYEETVRSAEHVNLMTETTIADNELPVTSQSRSSQEQISEVSTTSRHSTAKNSYSHSQTLSKNILNEPRSIWSILPSLCSSMEELSSPPRRTLAPKINVGTISVVRSIPLDVGSSPSLASLESSRQFCPPGSFTIYQDPSNSSGPPAKVGIVISRGRAMPLQDKHLHLAFANQPQLLNSANQESLSASDAKRLSGGIKRPAIHEQSENLAFKKPKQHHSGATGHMTAGSEFWTSANNAKQTNTRAFRNNNTLSTFPN